VARIAEDSVVVEVSPDNLWMHEIKIS